MSNSITCAIYQSNVFLRLATLAKLYAADVWVVLDDVQFNARDYQRRTWLAGFDPLHGQWLSLPVHRPLAGALAGDRSERRPVLSSREIEVLTEWFQSESKEFVAHRLGISPSTVNSHLERVRIKYAQIGREASTKVALAARAIQDGLIGVDDL